MLPFLVVTHALAAEPTHVSVETALATLEARNPSLARAEAQADAARGSATIALSGVLPSLTAVAGYTRNNAEASLDLSELFDVLGDLAEMTGGERPVAPDAVVIQPLESFNASGSLRVPLVAPGAWVSIAASRRGVEAADASLEASRSTLRATALQAFWSAGAAEAFVEAQAASVERARQLVTSAQTAVASGTSARLTLLEAQTDLARREGDLLQARANLEKARTAVGALLGGTEPVIVDLPQVSAPPPTETEAALADAYAHRGEVRAAEAQLAAARGQLLSVRLGALPTLSGSFNVSASSEPYVTGDNTAWKGTVDLTWPLLQGGARAGNETRAEAALADAAAALEAARVQVAQQVRNAVTDQGVAAARMDVAGRQRVLAEEAARVAQRSFDEGIADARTVLDALDRLDLARASEIDARARLGVAEAGLRAATGRW